MRKLVMLGGLPRSGKSTHALELAHSIPAPIVNPDSIRIAIHGYDYIQRAEPYVWATAHSMVIALFTAGHEVVILDAVNNTRRRRDEWKADQYYERHFIHVDTHPEECIRRLHHEDSKLREVIERMYRQHEPVSPDEGFVEVKKTSEQEMRPAPLRMTRDDKSMDWLRR